MYDELIKHLRSHGLQNPYLYGRHSSIFDEAADAIEKLQSELMRISPDKAWILIDDTFLQHGRPTSEDGMQWEFVQVDQLPGEEERYVVSHGYMELRDYSEDEVNDMLHSYGYEDFFSYVKEFPDFYKQGILEMFFETEVAGQNMSPAKSFNEAVAEVESITGSDLTQYKLPHRKPNLASQISGAEQRKESHTEQTPPEREGR